MLRGLRHKMAVSAAGRHLAIDLLETHGAEAGQVLEAMLRDCERDDAGYAILRKARRVLERLN